MGTARRVPVLLAHGKNMPRGEGDGRVRRGLCWPRKTSRKRLRGGSHRARGREERRDGKWRGGIRKDGDRRWEERRRETVVWSLGRPGRGDKPRPALMQGKE